jgi:hypothetical protein
MFMKKHLFYIFFILFGLLPVLAGCSNQTIPILVVPLGGAAEIAVTETPTIVLTTEPVLLLLSKICSFRGLWC